LSADLPEVGAGGVLQRLPRAERLSVREVSQQPEQIRREVVPAPSNAAAARRLLYWARVAVGFFGRNLGGRLRGRTSYAFRAARLRDALHARGGHARKVGRVLSARLDVLPYEHCEVLSSLSDEGEPPPIEQVVALVEAAAGAPLAEVFAAFDPDALRADTVASSHLALLRGGGRVQVTVRRPLAAETFAADRVAAGWMLRVTEGLTVVRSEFGEIVKEEIRQIIETELDFYARSRAQRLYRKFLVDDRLKGVDVAPVLPRLCSGDVIVRMAPDGVPLGVVIDAVQAGDQEVLARLAGLRIDPAKLADRLVCTSWWAVHEGVIFHHPEADDLVVLPGGKLVFSEVRRAGGASARVRRLHREMMRRLLRQDVSGAVEAVLQLLMPLPYVDVHALTRTMEARLGRVLLAMVDPESPWHERTAAGLWVGVLEITRSFGVPVRTEVMRLIGSTLAHQALAAALDPRFDLFATFQRYERQAARRSARRVVAEVKEADERGWDVTLMAQLAEVSDRVERLTFFADALTAFPPIQHLTLSGKAAYVVSIVLDTLTVCASLAVALSVGVALFGLWGGTAPGFATVLAEVSLHPAFLVVCAVMVWVGLRRIQYRLSDTESDG
jgi:ubiquinone biosynthesis protein